MSDYIILYDWICVSEGYCSLESVKEKQQTITEIPFCLTATRIVMEFSSSSKHLLNFGFFKAPKTYLKHQTWRYFAWMSRKKKNLPTGESLCSATRSTPTAAPGGDFGRILEEDSLGWCTKKDLLRPQINHIHVAGLPKPCNSGKYSNHLFIFKPYCKDPLLQCLGRSTIFLDLHTLYTCYIIYLMIL